MKTYIKYNYTLLKGYSYTSKLLNNYNRPRPLAIATASSIFNSLIGVSGGYECNTATGYKKYFHNHPVSKLEKILKKMNEKKLILPTPRENIESIFKANKINKVEIDKLLKIKRISNTSLLAQKFNTINAESINAPDSKLDQKLVSLTSSATFSLEIDVQKAEVSNNKKILNLYQENSAVGQAKKINLLKNLLYYNSSSINNKPYLFNKLFEAIFNNQVLNASATVRRSCPSTAAINTTIALLPQGRLQEPAVMTYTNKYAGTKASAVIKAKRLINKTKKSITSLTKTIPKTLINRKKIDPLKKKYVDYITLQIKRKLFYARMSRLVNLLKKKYKIFGYEAKIEALKLINTGKGSITGSENILVEENNRIRTINSEKKMISKRLVLAVRTQTAESRINGKIKSDQSLSVFGSEPRPTTKQLLSVKGSSSLDSSKSTEVLALKKIKKTIKFNNNLIQRKEKSFILCSKNNKLVTQIISKYNQMANKPKRKRNKRRGKLIKESMRHRFYYPFLTKINKTGYLYTMSFIRYEDQVNILYKLYLAKILKYKFKYLPSFAHIPKATTLRNIKRSINIHSSSSGNERASGVRLNKISDKSLASATVGSPAGGGKAIVADSTLIKAMNKRIQKRIKKGVRSKRIIRFIDNYYRYAYPKNGIKFNLLKIPRYKWYPLKIRKMYINKWLKLALNKYKYENKLNLKLLKNYKKHSLACVRTATGGDLLAFSHVLPLVSRLRMPMQPQVLVPTDASVMLSRFALRSKRANRNKESSNLKIKASLIRRLKKNLLIKVALQRWLKLNTEKRLLEFHKSAFSSYSYYTNLASYNTPTRKDSSSISLKKKEFLKYYLINDWLNKEDLLKDNYIIKNIKNELVSNYFLNKTFARRFKSFDSLSYEPRFLLDLLPYQMIDFFKHFGPEADQFNILTRLSLPHVPHVPYVSHAAPYLINTSIEYSVPIHFDTQMTINLFRNLIIKQAAAKAAKAKNKEKNLLRFSLKGNIFNTTNYGKYINKNKFVNLYMNSVSASSASALCRARTLAFLANLQDHTSFLRQNESTTIERMQASERGVHSVGLMLNILLLKEIEKDNKFKFLKTFAGSIKKSPKGSINLLASSVVSALVPAQASDQSALVPAQVYNTATGDKKLQNIVKVIQKLNILKKIKLIRRIKEVIFNKNKQFYLERLVNNIIVYNFRKKNNALSFRLGEQDASLKSKKLILAKASESIKINGAISRANLNASSVVPQSAGQQQSFRHLGLRKLLLKSKLNSLQHIQSTNRTLGREIITYNFNRNTRRFNNFNSFDFTGSSAALRRSHGSYLNISVLIKYFFKTIGGSIISKPLFIFNHNKITIKFFYYLSKNIYFFSTSEKNKLLFLWLKNSNLEPGYISNIMKKYKNLLAKNHNIPFKWTTLKNYSSATARMHLLRNKTSRQAFVRTQPGALRTRAHAREAKATKIARLTKYFLSKNNILENFKKEINAFTYILENYFNCSIQLEITRLKYPFYNSNILSQLIGLNGRKYGYEQVLRKLFPKIYIRNPKTTLTIYDLSPKRKKALVSYLSGIKLRIAGRFYKHKIIPKKTVNTYQRGSLQRGVINYVESSKYINKSKRGSFCITLTLSHIF